MYGDGEARAASGVANCRAAGMAVKVRDHACTAALSEPRLGRGVLLIGHPTNREFASILVGFESRVGVLYYTL